MGRHYSLRGGGSWSVTFSLSFASTSLSVMRCFVTHRGRFALVLACVLMQDIQGFRIRSRFASHCRTGTSFIAFITWWNLSAVRWKWVTCWQVGPCKEVKHAPLTLGRTVEIFLTEKLGRLHVSKPVSLLLSYLGSSASSQTASLCILGDPGHNPGCRGTHACMAYKTGVEAELKRTAYVLWGLYWSLCARQRLSRSVAQSRLCPLL